MNVGRSRLVVGCLLVVLVATGSMSLLAGPVDGQSGSVVFQQSALSADEVRITVDIHEDGSATWQLGFWRVLDDDDSRAAFDSLRADIRADPGNYTTEFGERIERTADAASNATGREMAVDNVTIATERQSLAREYGVVRYQFEWQGFARVDGDELAAGDAIDRLYLDDGTRMLIRWPEGYDLQSVAPEPDDRRETAVRWEGSDTEFIAGEPRVVVAPSGLGAGTLAGLLGVIAVLAGAGGWLLRRRSAAEAAEPASTTGDPAGTASEADSPVDEGSTAESDGPPPAEPTGDRSTEQAAEADQSTDDAEDGAEPDPSLLSNEEQVMRLLEANGGRMKQQTVVAELGWTDAKTSKVISGMREAGTIESFRIGRENVLTTPEDDPREPNP
ncbi:MAG: hypothetical protein R6V31_08150 [Halohasta sp.]